MEPNNLVYKVTIVGNDDTVLKQLAIYDNPTDAGLAIDGLQKKQNTGFIKSFDIDATSLTTFVCCSVNTSASFTCS